MPRSAALACPVVLDGDGLTSASPEAISERSVPTVLTPHDGEFRSLTGAMPSLDRFAAVRELAASTGAVVLLKGPVTLVADPSGRVLAAIAGDQRLATAEAATSSPASSVPSSPAGRTRSKQPLWPRRSTAWPAAAVTVSGSWPVISRIWWLTPFRE